MEHGKFRKIPEPLLEKIEEITLHAAMNDISMERNIKIKEHTKYKNNIQLEENGFIENPSVDNYWYEVGSEEISKIISENMFYTCIVIKKDNAFSEYRFGVVFFENEVDYEMIIFEKNNNDFVNNIIPRFVDDIGLSISKKL